MTCPDSSNDPFATTPEKKAFFDAFGFLVLRQAFSIEEFETMERAFEQVITDELRARDADRNQLIRVGMRTAGGAGRFLKDDLIRTVDQGITIPL